MKQWCRFVATKHGDLCVQMVGTIMLHEYCVNKKEYLQNVSFNLQARKMLSNVKHAVSRSASDALTFYAASIVVTSAICTGSEDDIAECSLSYDPGIKCSRIAINQCECKWILVMDMQFVFNCHAYMQTMNHATIPQTAFNLHGVLLTELADWKCVQAMSGELFVVMELLLLPLQL